MTTLATEGANSPSATGGGEGLPPQRIEGRTPLQLAWLRLKKDRVAIASAITILLLVLIAVFADPLTTPCTSGSSPPPRTRFLAAI